MVYRYEGVKGISFSILGALVNASLGLDGVIMALGLLVRIV